LDKLVYAILGKRVESTKTKAIAEVKQWPSWISSKFRSNDFRKFKHIGSIDTVNEIFRVTESDYKVTIKYGVSFLSKLAKFHIRQLPADPEYITIKPKKANALAIPFNSKWVGKKYPFFKELHYLPTKKGGWKHGMKAALGLASNRKAPILARVTRDTISPIYVLLQQVRHRREIDFPAMDDRLLSVKFPRLEKILGGKK
jgi:hypothetical protein